MHDRSQRKIELRGSGNSPVLITANKLRKSLTASITHKSESLGNGENQSILLA